MRRRADVPRRPHPHAARPHEVPGADPHHRAAAPVPAAGRTAGAGQPSPTSKRRSTTSPRPTGSREVLGRSLDDLPPQTRQLLPLVNDMVADGVRAAARPAPRLPLQPPRRAAGDGLGQHATQAAPGPPARRWNTCSCIAASGARASSTNCSTRRGGEDGRAVPAGPHRRGSITLRRKEVGVRR